MQEIIIGWIHDSLREFFNWFLAIMCQILGSLYEFLNEFLDKIDGKSLSVLETIGIALLTVMIPIAATLITGFAGEKKDFGVLDKNIIFKYIVNAERLLLGIALVFIPILLWDIVSSYPIFRIIHLILWGCGVGIMVKVLINVSYWQKGHEFKLRYEYLKTLKNPGEMREPWHSVWEVENIDGYREKEFFTIFSSTIDKLLRGDVEKIKIAVGLVDDFNSFIDKRSSGTLVISGENFSKILEWHFSMWEKTYQPRNEKNKNILGFYNLLLFSLSSTLKKIEERELKEDAFYFFSAFKPHVEKHKGFFVKIGQDGGGNYAEKIMPDFFDALIKNIENIEKICGSFPDEWEITSENIKKRESYVSRALHIEFIRWTRRIWSSTKYERILNDVAYYLFPRICLIMWAYILDFLMSDYWRDDKRMKLLAMKSLTSNYPIFDKRPRPEPGWKGDGIETKIERDKYVKQQRKMEEEETISLALLLFGYKFTQNNLNDYITGFEALDSTQGGEIMEYGKEEYITLFKKLLEARRKMDEEE